MKKIILLFFSFLVFGEFAFSSGGSEGGPKTLVLGSNLADTHPLGQALIKFSKDVEAATDGKIKINIRASGTLGTTKEMLEQLTAGTIDMVRAGSADLGAYDPVFDTYNLPYLFESNEHFYRAFEGKVGDELKKYTQDKDFVVLTFYDTGARSFYFKNTAISSPDDLKGLKVRVMNSSVSIKTMELMGATPTPMGYNEVYTALQQGVIDGAENNPTALTLSKHGEVAKEYSFDEHIRMPDFLIISQKTWSSFDQKTKDLFYKFAKESTEFHKTLWNKEVDASVKEAEAMGVKFNYPEKQPFFDKVQPIYEEYESNPQVKKIIDEIKALR